MTNFSVASNRKWTDNEGVLHEETIWIRVGDPLLDLTAGPASHTRSKGRQVKEE